MDIDRRRFVEATGMLLGLGVTPHAPAKSPAATGAPRTGAWAENTMRLANKSGTDTNVPIVFQRAFAQGSIRRAAKALLDGSEAGVATQCNPTQFWPDGSVKRARMCIGVARLGTTPRTMTFVDADTNDTTPISKASMLADYDLGQTDQIQMYAISGSGKAATFAPVATVGPVPDLRAAIEAGKFEVVIAGPMRTMVRVADFAGKSLDFGDDANRALRPWWYVDFFDVSGARSVEITKVIECSDVTKCKDQAFDVTARVGQDSPSAVPVYRFTGAPGVKMPIGTLVVRRFWHGRARPMVHIDHNPEFLVTSRDLPNWRHDLPVKQASIQHIVNMWNASAKGAFERGMIEVDRMPRGGGRLELAYVTAWDSVWAMSRLNNADLAMACESNALLCGAWPSFYREGERGRTFDYEAPAVEARGRWMTRDGRPGLTLLGRFGTGNPASQAQDKMTLVQENGLQNSGKGDYVWEGAHLFDSFYVSSLLTGHPIYLDMQQAWSTLIPCVNPGGRQDMGTWKDPRWFPNWESEQVRHYAWTWRMMMHTINCTPDGDPYRAYLSRVLNQSVSHAMGWRKITTGRPDRIRDQVAAATPWAWIVRYDGTPQENTFGHWDTGAVAGDVKVDDVWPSPTADRGGGASLWAQGYLLHVLGRLHELGFVGDKALACLSWASRGMIETWRLPGTKRSHLGDYAFPKFKNVDGKPQWYPSVQDAVDGFQWSHATAPLTVDRQDLMGLTCTHYLVWVSAAAAYFPLCGPEGAAAWGIAKRDYHDRIDWGVVHMWSNTPRA